VTTPLATSLSARQRYAKRAFDILIGGLLLLLSVPLMALIALLVKLESRGPVLYHQKRLGEKGRIFVMYKFRSMIPGADELIDQVVQISEDGHVLYKWQDDRRVTRLGRFLRRSSLDELPQLFNVLKGDMSLVGPRPELPWMLEHYETWQYERFTVPQGVTGLWQINGRADNPMYLNTGDDLHYINNYSLWLDVVILLKTVPAVLRGTGAY
jgi:lipopolysaccharide/colanic/teichoic acid biosynthesis glycosyltransferase